MVNRCWQVALLDNDLHVTFLYYLFCIKQNSIQSHGFFSGDDDMQWWEFGDGTHKALQMFQACRGLPQTGTTSPLVWELLLGDAADEGIEAATALGGPYVGEYETDLESVEGRVYLLGEDRFERDL